ncbi:MAG: transposase [Legionellales bacterium]|nr:transposase [Legionellales bacterium]
MRLFDGELLIVATTESSGLAITIYTLRWEIETLFSCLKGRGFNFEDTHIKTRQRHTLYLCMCAAAHCPNSSILCAAKNTKSIPHSPGIHYNKHVVIVPYPFPLLKPNDSILNQHRFLSHESMVF